MLPTRIWCCTCDSTSQLAERITEITISATEFYFGIIDVRDSISWPRQIMHFVDSMFYDRPQQFELICRTFCVMRSFKWLDYQNSVSKPHWTTPDTSSLAITTQFKTCLIDENTSISVTEIPGPVTLALLQTHLLTNTIKG